MSDLQNERENCAVSCPDDEIVVRKAARTPEGIEMGQHLARMCDLAEVEQRRRFPNQAQRCQTCAFRAGTLPNGDPVTLLDAVKCLVEMVPFMCHQYFNADGSPRDMCAGYALLLSYRNGKPGKMPWDFSKEVTPEQAAKIAPSGGLS